MDRRASLIVISLLMPGNAYALESFPGQIRSHLGLATKPQCFLCHASVSGGGPVSQPFGQSMITAGLTRSGGSSLTSALDKLAQDGIDSDGDGVSDIDELKAGTSPNPDKTPIEYGCGGQVAANGPRGFAPSIAFALTFLFVITRRTRGGQRSSKKLSP